MYPADFLFCVQIYQTILKHRDPLACVVVDKARYLSTTTHAHAQIRVRASPSVLASYSTLFKEIEKRKHMKEELFMTYIIKPALG